MKKQRKSGVILASVLASFLGGLAGAATLNGVIAERPTEAVEQQPKKAPLNPASQRAEMIRVLKSIDKHLAAVEKSVAK